MRNVSLAALDSSALSVLPIATDYPPGHLLDWHEHRRAQLLYAATGTMLVETADGAWTVPGGAGCAHPAANAAPRAHARRANEQPLH